MIMAMLIIILLSYKTTYAKFPKVNYLTRLMKAQAQGSGRIVT